MALPTEYGKVTVTGRYVYLNGQPAQGSIRFTGKVAQIAAAADTIVMPSAFTAWLDIDGAFSIALPATDDPDISNPGWTYQVEENLSGGGGRTFEMDVPISAAGTGIDLSAVAPTGPAQVGDPTTFATISALADLRADTQFPSASLLPAVVTNLVPDPQLKVAGGPTDAAVWTTQARDATVFPPGTTNSARVARTSSTSEPTVAARVALASASTSNPLRIQVTPGVPVSISCWVRTAYAAGATSSISTIWLDAAGTSIPGPATGPTLDAFPANTWVRVTWDNVIPPPGTVLVYPYVTLTSADGGNVAAGTVSWVGATQVSPTLTTRDYGDGTFPGWRWSGTAHASTSVRYSGESSTTLDSTYVTHPQPAVVTNLARDPQLRLAGGSNNLAVYAASRDTVTVPPGTASSLKLTRTSDTSNATIIGSHLLTAFQVTDPRRILVTPGQPYSAVVSVRTTYAAGCTAQLNFVWHDAAGTNLSTSTGPFITGIPANTWRQVTFTNVIAPAGAAFVHIYVNIFTADNGNAYTGAPASWSSAVQMTNTATQREYGDGTFPGWRWSGTAHASTSVRYAAESAALGEKTYVSYDALPAVLTNLVPDPQLMVAGSSNNGANWGLSRVTDVVPPGATAAMRINFVGPSGAPATFASAYVGAASVGDPLRVQLGAGVTASYSMWVRTDQPNAQAMLSISPRNSAGTTLSTINGPTVDLPQNTWTELRMEGFTTAAGTAMVIPLIAVSTRDGSTAPVGALSWFSKVQVTATQVVYDYGDGSIPGWRWTGTPHASPSVRYAGIPVAGVESAAARDTGVRTVISFDTAGNITVGSLLPGWKPQAGIAGYVKVRRIDKTVHVLIVRVAQAVAASQDRIWTAPAGFVPSPFFNVGIQYVHLFRGTTLIPYGLLATLGRGSNLGTAVDDYILDAYITYPTDDPWPTTLPGIAG